MKRLTVLVMVAGIIFMLFPIKCYAYDIDAGIVLYNGESTKNHLLFLKN